MQLRLMQGVVLTKLDINLFFFYFLFQSRFSLFAFLSNISIVYKYFNVWQGDL